MSDEFKGFIYLALAVAAGNILTYAIAQGLALTVAAIQ